MLHESHPCDVLIFDHTALAVATCSLLPVLLSAIPSFLFAGRGFHFSVPTTTELTTYTQLTTVGFISLVEHEKWIWYPHLKNLNSNHRCSIPVFLSRRILVIGQERTTGRKSPQVELGHVRQRDVDWSVVSEEETNVSGRLSLNNNSWISASVSPLGLTCWNPPPWRRVWWSDPLKQTSLMRTKEERVHWLTLPTTHTAAFLKVLLCCHLCSDL